MPEVIKRRRNYSKIAISQEETNSFLDSQTWLRVATLDSKEEIWNLPVHFVRMGESIYFDESPDSIMLANIERYHNVCAVADTGYSYDDLVGTIVQGDAFVVDDKKTIDSVVSAMNDKYAS